MGDVAMTAPVLAQVAAAYPEVEIVLLTRRFYEPFFDGIDRLTIHNINIDQGQAHRGIKGLVRLYRELRRCCPGVEMVIDLQDKIYSKLLRKFYRLAGVKTFHIDKGRVEKKHLTAVPGKGKVMRQLRTSIDRYADIGGSGRCRRVWAFRRRRGMCGSGSRRLRNIRARSIRWKRCRR